MNNKNKQLICCILGGWFGLHHFMNKRIGLGILYLLTGGLFYIGWIIDIIILAASSENTPNKYDKEETGNRQLSQNNCPNNNTISNNYYDYGLCSIRKKGYVDYQYYYNSYNERKTNTITKDYVVFDTETTGLDPSFDKIIEISAIKYKNNQKIEEYSILINPKERISGFITNLTGIKQIDLNNKPTFSECIKYFFNFIEDYTLVAHNAQYDIKMLQAECVRNNIKMCDNKVIDTVALAKRIIPKSCIDNYKLVTLKEYFNIDVKSHRALDDCVTCARVYQYYLEQSLTNLRFILNSNIDTISKEKEVAKYNKLNGTNYKYIDRHLCNLTTGEIIE